MAESSNEPRDIAPVLLRAIKVLGTVCALIPLPPILYVAYVFIAAALGPFFNPTPTLGRNLTDQIFVAIKEFDQRVKQQFPVGSSEQDMVAELRREGFAEFGSGSERFPKWARWDGPGQIVCRKELSVIWRSGSDGRIAEISGQYDNICL